MNNWTKRNLGSVCSQVLTGGTPSTKVAEYYIGGQIPWLKTKEVNFCRIENTENYITQSGLANSSAKLVPPNSVIVAMYGQGDTAGRVAINKIPLTTNQACCNLVIDSEIADYQFIYFYLKNSYAELVQRKTGSAQPNLNTKLIKDFEIFLPSLDEQKAITAVLASLDDKIDLLHRQNKTLESLAQTLFRHWFIDGAEDDWEDGALGDFINIAYGKNIPTKLLLPEGYPVFGGNGQIGFYKKYLYEEPQVLIACRGAASGAVHISLPKSFVTNNSLVLEIPKDSRITFEYLKYFALNADFDPYVSGSAQPQITINDLSFAEFMLPPKEQIAEFSTMVQKLESKRTLNFRQIQTLQKLRDTLLPKLMSGEVRVRLRQQN